MKGGVMKSKIKLSLLISILVVFLTSCTSESSDSLSEITGTGSTVNEIEESTDNSGSTSNGSDVTSGELFESILSSGSFNLSVESEESLSSQITSSLLKHAASYGLTVTIEPDSWIEINSTLTTSDPFYTDDNWINFGGDITFSFYTNETATYDTIKFEISMDNGGLLGDTDGTIMPVRLVNEENETEEISTSDAVFFEDTNSSVVDDYVTLEVEVSTIDLPAQVYSGTLNYKLVGYSSDSGTSIDATDVDVSSNVTTETSTSPVYSYDTYELHGINIYRSSTEPEMDIIIDRPGVNTILALYSASDVIWDISLVTGSHVSEVYIYNVFGYDIEVIGLDDDVTIHYNDDIDYYVYSHNDSELHEHIAQVYNDTGYTFSSLITGYYSSSSDFIIDEIDVKDYYSPNYPEVDDTTNLPDLSFNVALNGELVPFNQSGPTDENSTNFPTGVDERNYARNDSFSAYMYLEGSEYYDQDIHFVDFSDGTLNSLAASDPSGTSYISDVAYNTTANVFYALDHLNGKVHEYNTDDDTWTEIIDIDTYSRDEFKMVYNPSDNHLYTVSDLSSTRYGSSFDIIKINPITGTEVSTTTISGSYFYKSFDLIDLLVDENGELILFLDEELLYHIDLDNKEGTLFYKIEQE